MRESRTQENPRFEKFFSFVREAAEKKGCIFFVDCGEGRDRTVGDMECMDLSGWLIPEQEAAEFEKEFTSSGVSEKWNDFVTFALWNDMNGQPIIDFKSF